MWKKKEVVQEVKENNLLNELCGDDARLRDFLGLNLYERPLEAISKKNLDILIEEAEKNGDFRTAVDKAIFDAAQNPGERGKYSKILQGLALKSLPSMMNQKEKAEKEGLNDWAASIGRRIEHQKFMNERAEDIINAASKFYKEKLVEREEYVRRQSRKEEKIEAERDEWLAEESEKKEREERKKERSEMGKDEKREAEKQDKQEEQAALERKEARMGAKLEAEREERKIEEQETEAREARKKERKGN
jgi:hypothetical protein